MQACRTTATAGSGWASPTTRSMVASLGSSMPWLRGVTRARYATVCRRTTTPEQRTCASSRCRRSADRSTGPAWRLWRPRADGARARPGRLGDDDSPPVEPNVLDSSPCNDAGKVLRARGEQHCVTRASDGEGARLVSFAEYEHAFRHVRMRRTDGIL